MIKSEIINISVFLYTSVAMIVSPALIAGATSVPPYNYFCKNEIKFSIVKPPERSKVSILVEKIIIMLGCLVWPLIPSTW